MTNQLEAGPPRTHSRASLTAVTAVATATYYVDPSDADSAASSEATNPCHRLVSGGWNVVAVAMVHAS